MFDTLKALLPFRRMPEEQFQAERERILDAAPIPVFWLFGKTGSGKTSIIKNLTGAQEAEIGNGFRPQTKFSHEYDFPGPENPVVRFLDTQGLGEGNYDPQEDIRAFDSSAHVMIVTVRALDHALAEVVEPLKEMRQQSPQRPVLLAITHLHEAYPQQQHPNPDPFDNATIPDDLPGELGRSIRQQQQRFEGLVDGVVAIDFTKQEEGLHPPDFGSGRLKAALVHLLPAAYRQTLLNLDDAMKSLKDLTERRAMPFIISYSTMSATAAAVPIPWVDIPLVLAIQSHLVYKLAGLYGQEWNKHLMQTAASSVGGRLLTRMLIRGPLKVIPFAGMAANAGLAFAYTYAQGKAWCWYFSEMKAGHAPQPEDLERIWKEQISVATDLWKRHRDAEPGS